MKKIIVLFIFGVLSVSSLAHAEEKSVSLTVEMGVSTRYIYQDLGLLNSNKPGLYTDLTVGYGPCSLDWWQRADAAGGKYGERGFGDEHDFTFVCGRNAFGLDFEVSAAYWMYAPFDKGRDDVIEVYADAGKTFDIGSGFSVTPAVRVLEDFGLPDEPTITLVRFRLPIAVEILPAVTVEFDPSVTVNATPASWQHRMVFRPTGTVTWQVTKAFSLTFAALATDYTSPEFDFGVVYDF